MFSINKINSALLLTGSVLFTSCAVDPQKFFDVVVLNSNNFREFGTARFGKRISETTVDYDTKNPAKKNGDEAVKYVELQTLILEQGLKKVQDMPDNESTKELKEEAIALYNYILPVYKNEYTAFAKLCDAKATKEEQDAILITIDQKYNPEFEHKFDVFLKKGKEFAEKHKLNVKWD